MFPVVYEISAEVLKLINVWQLHVHVYQLTINYWKCTRIFLIRTSERTRRLNNTSCYKFETLQKRLRMLS